MGGNKITFAVLLSVILVLGIVPSHAFAADDNDKKQKEEKKIEEQQKKQEDTKEPNDNSNKVLTGDGPPPSKLGNLDDLYIDSANTDNLVIYKKSAKDTWTNLGSFQGPSGQSGADCWDLNSSGAADPDEDTNGDGTIDVLDCRGTQGQPGSDGENGISCWDLNENGVADPDEDTNGDGTIDVLDCKAPQGGQDSQDLISKLESRIAFLESFLDLTGLVRTSEGGQALPITIDGTVEVTWTPHAVITDSGGECVSYDNSCPLFGSCGGPRCVAYSYHSNGHSEWTPTYEVQIDNTENLPQAILVDDMSTFDLSMTGNDQNDHAIKLVMPDGSESVLNQGTQTLTSSSVGPATIQLDGSDGLLARLSALLESTMPAQTNIGCNGPSPCTPSLPYPQTFTESATTNIRIEIMP